MLVPIGNKDVLRRVHETIEGMEDYKKQLQKFVLAISRGSASSKVARPGSFLLTHFTNKRDAASIIREGKLKVNDKNYIALTELNEMLPDLADLHANSTNLSAYGEVSATVQTFSGNSGTYKCVFGSDSVTRRL